MELTKEHFDEQFIQLATKEDLANQSKELIKYVDEKVEHLARLVAEDVAIPLQAVIKKLDDRDRVEKLEEEVHELKLKTALRFGSN